MRAWMLVLVLAAVACGTGELRVSDVYGAWRLESAAGGAAPAEGVPRFVQFTPGGEAILSLDGRTLERRRFSFRRGIPVGAVDEAFLLVIEGEPDNWIVEAPDRRTLILTPNNFDDPPRRYLRER